MGCTSSAANIPDSQSSTTDNMENNYINEKSEEPVKKNDVNQSNTEELEKIRVLPECEITDNEIHVASEDNNKSFSEIIDVNTKDNEDTVPTDSHEDNIPVPEPSPLKENFVSLKVLVEKVISDKPDEHEQITNEIEPRIVDLDRQIEEIMESNSEDGEVEPHEDDETKESQSPTQSEDSRATRWEALADIAAELPPSLAVDPLTGQIYSLAK